MNEYINVLLHNRRSVFPKDYTGEKVEDAIVQQLLENANWAPTHKVTEPWRFVVFTGLGIDRLAQFQSEFYKKVSVENGTFDQKKYDGLRTKPKLSSHIIAVGMKRDEKNQFLKRKKWGLLPAPFKICI